MLTHSLLYKEKLERFQRTRAAGKCAGGSSGRPYVGIEQQQHRAEGEP